MLLHVDLALKVHSVAQLHKLMGVAGVAVFAGELATAVGVDGPGEGHARHVAAVEQGTHRQSEKFYIVAGLEELPLGSQAGDANQGLGRVLGEQGKGSHKQEIRFLFAIENSAGRGGLSILKAEAAKEVVACAEAEVAAGDVNGFETA